MVVDLKDFILVKNGLGQKKKYRMTCNSCGIDRSYQMLRDQYRECKECSIKITIPDNVIKDDFKKSNSNPNQRIYRMTCIRCNQDKGYRLLNSSDKLCRACVITEIHGVIPNMEYISVLDNNKVYRRRYFTNCKECGKSTGLKKKYQVSQGTGLCRTCFGYTLKDRQFSEDTKLKMSESQKKRDRSQDIPLMHSEETKKKLSEAQKQYCIEHGNQFVSGKSQGKHSEESVNKMSISNLGKQPKWKGRTFQYDGAKGIFKMRSSYELAYAKHLDSKNIQWEYEPKFILSSGKGFCPDFRLEDGTIVEIKGFWTDNARAKWELFKADNAQLHTQVIMKNDLLKLGLEVK